MTLSNPYSRLLLVMNLINLAVILSNGKYSNLAF